MDTPLRLLFVATPPGAAEALTAVREGGAVSAHLVSTGDALREAFAAGPSSWDAVVVVPGSPVADAEVATFVPDGVAIWVVAPEVPLLLTDTAARAVPVYDLPALVSMHRGAVVLEGSADEPSLPPSASGDGALGADAAPALSVSSPPGAAGPPNPPDAPTPMLDFRFGRSAAAPPDPTPAPAAPEAAPQLADTPVPEAPVSEAPASEAPVQDEAPVLIVRNRAEEAPAAGPEADADPAPPEDVEVVEPEADAHPSVLVVEDNNDTRMLLERILRSTYEVRAVGDARSALLAMNERRFSGLVLDINLGGKETGADVLRIARSLPGYGDVFAIALTAYALPGDRERLLAAGFNEYISKPFTRQSLMDTLAAGVAA